MVFLEISCPRISPWSSPYIICELFNLLLGGKKLLGITKGRDLKQVIVKCSYWSLHFFSVECRFSALNKYIAINLIEIIQTVSLKEKLRSLAINCDDKKTLKQITHRPVFPFTYMPDYYAYLLQLFKI